MSVYLIKVGSKVVFKSASRANAERYLSRCGNAKLLVIPATNAAR